MKTRFRNLDRERQTVRQNAERSLAMQFQTAFADGDPHRVKGALAGMLACIQRSSCPNCRRSTCEAAVWLIYLWCTAKKELHDILDQFADSREDDENPDVAAYRRGLREIAHRSMPPDPRSLYSAVG